MISILKIWNMPADCCTPDFRRIEEGILNIAKQLGNLTLEVVFPLNAGVITLEEKPIILDLTNMDQDQGKAFLPKVKVFLEKKIKSKIVF